MQSALSLSCSCYKVPFHATPIIFLFTFRYQLADNIDAQLKRMVQDLKEIIDHLNTSSSQQDSTDPVSFVFYIHHTCFNPIALRKAKIACSFDPSVCNRLKKDKSRCPIFF